MSQQVGKKKLFTPQMIERLRPPSAGRLEIADSNCPGLVLRVTDQGTKTLAVIFKVPGEGGVSTKGRLMAGRQHRITLGRWPGVGLKEAQEKARVYLSDVTEGRNPKSVLLEQNSIRHTNTVAAVVERFIAQECKGTVRSWANIDRVLRLHVLPSAARTFTASSMGLWSRASWARAGRSASTCRSSSTGPSTGNWCWRTPSAA